MVRTILLTGFGPFRKVPFNPTGPLVRRLAAGRRPAFASTRRIAHVFRTSYAAVDRELPDLIERYRPDALIMFGLAPRTPHVRIEVRARKVSSGLLPNPDGVARSWGLVRGHDVVPAGGRAPFQKLLVAARRVRVPVALSHDPGTYLCNYLYWRAVEQTQNSPIPLIVFVHVPKIADGRFRRASAKRRRLFLADLVRVGEALLTALVPHLRSRR